LNFSKECGHSSKIARGTITIIVLKTGLEMITIRRIEVLKN